MPETIVRTIEDHTSGKDITALIEKVDQRTSDYLQRMRAQHPSITVLSLTSHWHSAPDHVLIYAHTAVLDIPTLPSHAQVTEQFVPHPEETVPHPEQTSKEIVELFDTIEIGTAPKTAIPMV